MNWDWQLGAQDSQINFTGLQLIDVDGFNASAATVARAKAAGVYTVCYLDVGSWEAGRPDSADYPDYLKIQKDPDWPEYFLDINDVWKPGSALAAILQKRFAMCAEKGFDAVEPDNLQNDENVSGGKITLQNQLDFDGWVADHVHAAGLAVFQKNGPDKSVMKDKQGRVLADLFDAVLNEQCQQYGECPELSAYTLRHKLVLDTEYKQSLSLNCVVSKTLDLNMISRDLNLVAPGMKGYKRTDCL